MEQLDEPAGAHDHFFLGDGHEENERKTWGVIVLCALMMVIEIVGGTVYGSLALVADGLHMSTHAGAMLIAALAYTYARRHASDSRFVFGTGKLGDLAGFTSAIVLAMIALLIGYEGVLRFLHPVGIRFNEAIAIASLGLVVNVVSAWLLSGDEHGGHDHAHGHDHDHDHDHEHEHHGKASATTLRDHSIRSAYVHVIADAVVSVLAITGLALARLYGWLWMDPLAGIIGAVIIASWSYSLICDTGAILLDICPDSGAREKVRQAIEIDGDRVTDLHLWRLGPGHLAAELQVATSRSREPGFYKARLESFEALSHVTVEVTRAKP